MPRIFQWCFCIVFLIGGAPSTLAQTQAFEPDAIPAQQYWKNPALADAEKEYFLAIFGGSTRGVYYYVASAICDAMRARFAEHRIRCVPLRSHGVTSNRQLLEAGRAQMAIIQSDTNFAAAEGRVPILGARSVMSLHDEAGVLVSRPYSAIAHPSDLRGRRVNLAPEGSGARQLWQHYLPVFGLAEADLEELPYFAQDLNYQAACAKYIDSFALWSGHPVPALTEAIERCQLELNGMWFDELSALLAQHQYYFRSTIPAGTYPGQTGPLQTYGVKATLVAHEQTLPYIVYWLTKVVAEDLDALRTRHPALAMLERRRMFTEGNFLPFHPGALQYWEQVNWDEPTETSAK